MGQLLRKYRRITGEDLSCNLQALDILHERVETGKLELSKHNHTTILLDFLPKHLLSLNTTRSELVSLSAELFRAVLSLIQNLLRRSTELDITISEVRVLSCSFFLLPHILVGPPRWGFCASSRPYRLYSASSQSNSTHVSHKPGVRFHNRRSHGYSASGYPAVLKPLYTHIW